MKKSWKSPGILFSHSRANPARAKGNRIMQGLNLDLAES